MQPISGILNDHEPFVVVKVVRSKIASGVKCRIDTGFSGDILVDAHDFEFLFDARLLKSPERRGTYGFYELADGTTRPYWLYESQVDWVNGNQDVDVVVPLDDQKRLPVADIQNLLGLDLLIGYCLLIDYPNDAVQIYQ